METSFDYCRRELLGKANQDGRAAYEQWRNRDGYGKIWLATDDAVSQLQDELVQTGQS